MHAVRIHENGGPEVLKYEQTPDPQLKHGDFLVKVEAVGVNFIDIYRRTGLYPVALPHILGAEAAGIVARIGPGVSGVNVGDRVATVDAAGAYADYTVVPADRLVPIPDGVETTVAAAVMLQGMTAHYLVNSTYPIQRGDHVLVHAAAGGVGLLLTQMAKQLGATVYGTVSTAEKAALARDAGVDEVIMYNESDVATEVRRLTGGKGVAVVYDSVGKTTFEGSLDSLRRRGYLVSYGQSSGVVPPVAMHTLNVKGSLFLTRPTLAHYVETRADLLARSGALWQQILGGQLNVRIGHTYPLAEAAAAQAALAGRATTGKVILHP
ncbi:MAG: quinone oxidoreductase [Herpetosiphon sp.]